MGIFTSKQDNFATLNQRLEKIEQAADLNGDGIVTKKSCKNL